MDGKRPIRARFVSYPNSPCGCRASVHCRTTEEAAS